MRRSGKSIVLQAKRYTGKIGIKAVQEIIGARTYYRCDKTMVVTNSSFTSGAVKLAAASGVALWNRNKITDVLVADKKATRCHCSNGIRESRELPRLSL